MLEVNKMRFILIVSMVALLMLHVAGAVTSTSIVENEARTVGGSSVTLLETDAAGNRATIVLDGVTLNLLEGEEQVVNGVKVKVKNVYEMPSTQPYIEVEIEPVETGQPDLIITGMSVNPENPMIGDVVMIVFAIKNIGLKTADVQSVHWDADGASFVGSENVGSSTLAPGQSYSVITRWVYNSAGSYRFWAKADGWNDISESNENNNEFETKFYVGGVVSCTDSDGGINYQVKGTVKGRPNWANGPSVVEVADACVPDGSTGGAVQVESGTLNEAYCNGDTLAWSTYQCSCRDGRCASLKNTCGDGVCTAEENIEVCPIVHCPEGAQCEPSPGRCVKSCEADCGSTKPGYCGDGICSTSENSEVCTSTPCACPHGELCACPQDMSNCRKACESDCGYTKPGYCGDGVCTSDEKAEVCSTVACTEECVNDESCECKKHKPLCQPSCVADCGSSDDDPLYRFARFTCYDGSSYSEGDSSSCQSEKSWRAYANKVCRTKCMATDSANVGYLKCGVNSFALDSPCSGSYSADVIYAKTGERFELSTNQYAVIQDYYEATVRLDGIAYPMANRADRNAVTSESASFATPFASVTLVLDICKERACKVAVQKWSVSMRVGDVVPFGDAQLHLLDISNAQAVFMVTHDVQGTPSSAYLTITPEQVKIAPGDVAEYTIVLEDKHAQIQCFTTPCVQPVYHYYLKVKGLPFYVEHQAYLDLVAGETRTIPLKVIPYEIETAPTVTLVNGESSSGVSADTVIVKKAQVQSIPVTANVVETVPSIREISADLVEVPSERRAYSFTVEAWLDNEEPARAKAMLIITPNTPPEVPTDTVTIKLYRGWNIVSLPGELNRFIGNEGNGKLIAYIYLPTENRYVTLKDAQNILGEKFSSFMANTAFWVYSYQNQALTVKVDYNVANTISLSPGWNFVPIRPDWVLSSIDKLDTTCTFTKLYGWDPRSQQWSVLDLTYQFQGWEENRGFLVKVPSSCSISTSSVIVPPPLPED